MSRQGYCSLKNFTRVANGASSQAFNLGVLAPWWFFPTADLALLLFVFPFVHALEDCEPGFLRVRDRERLEFVRRTKV